MPDRVRHDKVNGIAPNPAKSKSLVPVKPPGVRKLAAQATREGILKAAIKVFAKSGFAGGRVEKISKAAKSYDRMIYYYFGSKEGLFIAALEEIYRRFCEAEAKVDPDMAQPVESLKTMVRFTWNYYQKHPEFITLPNSENLHQRSPPWLPHCRLRSPE